jgi:hypothetical protein
MSRKEKPSKIPPVNGLGWRGFILLAGVGERPINCNLLVEVLLLVSK